jgi:tripartite-type tricarboxylate transporter receptor subunit TctC
MSRRAFLQTAVFGTGMALTTIGRSFSESFPSRGVRIVVPASASTPPDILARIIANAISDREGWKMIVENKPGAVMTISPTC